MDRNKGIGIRGRLPWHLSSDLGRFRSLTLFKPVIMGNGTYRSIGKPLPFRHNIVLTRRSHMNEFMFKNTVEDCIEHALRRIEVGTENPEIFVIGGASVYKLFMPIASKLYITHVDHTFKCDRFFPAWDDTYWDVVSNERFLDDWWPYEFCVYKRI